MRRIAVVPLAVLTALGTACTTFGPSRLPANRLDYNEAIQRTNQEELLLNLVRLRYRDTPYFLSVERVAATFELNQSAGLGASLPEGGTRTLSVSGLGASINEKPTVFYAPVEGEKFVKQLMTPIGLETVLLLSYSGWSVERIFRATVREMNGLRNAPTASGPTPGAEPEYRPFREAVRLLRSLQTRGVGEMGRVVVNGEPALELRYQPEDREDADLVAFKKLLRLDPGRDAFRIVPGVTYVDGGTISVGTRGLWAVMSYLGQGTDIPEADRAAGRVTTTLGADGQPFDWQRLLGGLMHIRSSPSRPRDAAVAVKHRGSWFSLADDDLDSRSTFMLVAQLFSLQGGEVKGGGPVLSFSVK